MCLPELCDSDTLEGHFGLHGNSLVCMDIVVLVCHFGLHDSHTVVWTSNHDSSSLVWTLVLLCHFGLHDSHTIVWTSNHDSSTLVCGHWSYCGSLVFGALIP